MCSEGESTGHFLTVELWTNALSLICKMGQSHHLLYGVAVKIRRASEGERPSTVSGTPQVRNPWELLLVMVLLL